MRCLYVDLDGTLLGRGASLLHDGDGDFTLLGVRALEACARAVRLRCKVHTLASSSLIT